MPPPRQRSNTLTIGPVRKVLNPQTNTKRPSAQGEQNESSSEMQPISDFPSPPVQIVSCRHTQPGELIPLPQLSTAPIGEIPQLTFQKIKQCIRICDFSDSKSDLSSKDTKKSALNELIDVYSNPKMITRLTRECHAQIIEMFAVNVFRPLPNIPRALLFSDEVTFEDSAWPHLSLIYILFLKFLESQIDPRILQYQLTPRYITQLFAALDFPDERERAQAKAVISTIFNKVPPQRPLLRLITTNLLAGVPEGGSINATGYLLELFHLFTAGTPPPLSSGLLSAFERVVLPLHLLPRLQTYHHPLVRCVLLMIRKEPKLCITLLKFLITHWPLTLDHKSELFIDEISQIFDETMPQDVSSQISSLLECVSIAAESPSMTLAEKALKFMINQRVQASIIAKPTELITQVFPSLFRVAREHWHRNVQVTALTVMNTLMELNIEAFKSVAEQFKEKSYSESSVKEQKKTFWDQIVQQAIQKDPSIDSSIVDRDMDSYFGFSKSKIKEKRSVRKRSMTQINPI